MFVVVQLISAQPYGEKIDEWAAGVTMFIMLSGYAPFQERDKEAFRAKICSGTIPFKDAYWSHVHAWARELVSFLLTKVRACVRVCVCVCVCVCACVCACGNIGCCAVRGDLTLCW